MIVEVDDFLEHHGVLGMKWGARRQSGLGSSFATTHQHQTAKEFLTSDRTKRTVKTVATVALIAAGTAFVVHNANVNSQLRLQKQLLNSDRARKAVFEAAKGVPPARQVDFSYIRKAGTSATRAATAARTGRY